MTTIFLPLNTVSQHEQEQVFLSMVLLYCFQSLENITMWITGIMKGKAMAKNITQKAGFLYGAHAKTALDL